MKRNIVFIILLVLFVGCGSGENNATEESKTVVGEGGNVEFEVMVDEFTDVSTENIKIISEDRKSFLFFASINDDMVLLGWHHRKYVDSSCFIEYRINHGEIQTLFGKSGENELFSITDSDDIKRFVDQLLKSEKKGNTDLLVRLINDTPSKRQFDFKGLGEAISKSTKLKKFFDQTLLN